MKLTASTCFRLQAYNFYAKKQPIQPEKSGEDSVIWRLQAESAVGLQHYMAALRNHHKRIGVAKPADCQ